MIKMLYTVFIVIFVFGMRINASEITEVNSFGNDFKVALELYNKQDFNSAYNIFQKLFEQNTADLQVNFYLGRCATELKLYDNAISAFERVLILDSNHTRSKMEIGRIYFEQKDFEQAKEQFNEVLEENIPTEVKEQIKKYLIAIENDTKRNSISGALIFGYNYDTNVKNSPKYLPNGFSGGNQRTKDSSLSETLSLNHSYKFDRSYFSWQNNLLLHNQIYNATHDSNILYGQFSSGFNYKTQSYELSFLPNIDKLIFGGVDMMKSFGASGKFMLNISQNILFEQVVGIKRQLFNEANKGMNTNIFESSTTIKKLIDNDKIAGIGFITTKNNQIYDGRTDVNQKSKALKLDFSMPINKINIATSFTFKKVNYINEDIVLESIRKDYSRTYNFSLTKQLYDTYLITGSATRLINSSNFETSNYQKNTCNISLIKTF